VPALVDFDPELIVLSSGQDAGACDPLGRMSVTAEGFRRMTSSIVGAAESNGGSCAGRIVAIQEGGYSIDHMPFCVLATVEALAGLDPALDRDPVEMDVPTGIRPIEADAIRAAADRLG
jgi:acetoin utilization deacetylase AcuC-like enzyme